MKKRLVSFALAATMIASTLAGCRGAEQATEAPETTAAQAAEAGDETEGEAAAEGAEGEAQATENFKIGIITGTASQGDEEITQANKMKEKYGDE